MTEPNTENELPKKPKMRKGLFLSQVVGIEVDEILGSYELEQKIEIGEHLILSFGEIDEYYKTKDNSVYQKFVKREHELLKRYGKAFKPYNQKQIYRLFEIERVLISKNYYTEEETNKGICYEDDPLTELDIEQFIRGILNALHWDIRFTYLEREPQFEITTKDTNSKIKEEADKEITEARQLLAIYFLLKAGFDIEHRGSNSVSETTRFVHLMTGTKFTTLQKSSIYKKYKLLPSYNTEEYLIKDLRFIRPYFDALHIQKALDLIDNEIETTIKALPQSRRKLYQ